MKKSILFLLLFSFAVVLNAQDWLNYLPNDKAASEYSLYDYRRAFDRYCAEKKVNSKGYYLDRAGNRKKMPYWKQFNRWYYYWEPRVDAATGAFPSTNAQEQMTLFRAQQQGSQIRSNAHANWTSIGPNSSPGGYDGTGRVNCVAFHPGDNNTYWAGSASGGLWGTTDNGVSWTCLTDQNAVMGVSDIAIPSDYATSQTIYIATGDRDGGSMWSLNGGQYYDNATVGVLKSTDGGTTWGATGLVYNASEQRMISRLRIHPNNNNILFASGSFGIKKSTDGGITWTNVYSGNTVMDMEYKPGDPTTMYASTYGWSGDRLILRSTNSGASWSTVYSISSARRIDIAVSPANSSYLYAVAADSDGSLMGVYRSTDGGDSFTLQYDGSQTQHNLLGYYTDGSEDNEGQGSYDLAIAVSPSDADEVYVGGVITHKSTDGGTTWNAVNCWVSSSTYNKNGAPVVHSDHHMLRYRTSDNQLFETNDGGLYSTVDGGGSWQDKTGNMVISQIYRISPAQSVAGEVLAGLQDNGTKLLNNTWQNVKGGDGMECIIDYTNPDIQYGCYTNGAIERTINHWASWAGRKDIKPDGSTDGAWVTPYVINPENPNSLIAGYADVWKTTDRGDNWTKISTINSSDKLRSIAVASSDSNTIYVADKKKIWVTHNSGSSWTEITSGLPSSARNITYIAVKHDDPNTLWITFGGYNSDKVFQSTNGGSSWTNISSGLPNIPVMCIVQNKLNDSQTELYIGTDIGVYIKQGSNVWEFYNTNLPNVVVADLDIYYDMNNLENSQLYAGTYGRGLWSSPLQSASCTAPATQASAFVSSDVNSTSADISWTRGSGNRIIVIAKEGAPVDVHPAFKQSYTANAAFAGGDEIGTGNFVVYDGTGTNVSLSALSPGKQYYFALYEYASLSKCYLLPPATGMLTTAGPPTLTTTLISSITSSSAVSGGDVISLNGTSLTAKGVCWSTNPNPTIADTHSNDIAQGTTIGGFTSDITALTEYTTYYVRAYATNSSGTAYGNEMSFIAGCGALTSFPWTEDFENGGNIPACWTQEYVSGNVDYTFISGGNSSKPSAAHGGSYNALLYMSSYNGEKTKLITPVLDLTMGLDPVLSFWHAQADWQGDQDELRVFYRTSQLDPWMLIPNQEYVSDISSWAQETNIPLPNPSSTYQIAFEGGVNYGHGVAIDDIEVKMLGVQGKITEGKLTQCSPIFSRDGSADAYFYDQINFTSNANATVSITGDWTTGSTPFDGYLYLYENSFDPNNPTTNLIASNDNFISSNFSKIENVNVTTGQTYIIVVTSNTPNLTINNFRMAVAPESGITMNAVMDYNGVPDQAYHRIPASDGTIYSADYECDDENQWTHYYDDAGTVNDYSDDYLLLSVKKNGNNIGTIAGGLTASLYSKAGISHIVNPPANYVTSAGGLYMLNRYWNISPTVQPSSGINVRYYYLQSDFDALEAAFVTAGGTAPLHKENITSFKINNITSNFDPNPSNGHQGIPLATVYNKDGLWMYTHAALASTNNWHSTAVRNGFAAEYVVGHLSGGGGMAKKVEVIPLLFIRLNKNVGSRCKIN